MKKILSIILIIVLFLVSAFIFWAGLAPTSFNKFWARYPQVTSTINKVRLVKTQGIQLSFATSSEPIKSANGQVIIKDNAWTVEVARTEQERESGLSNRRALYHQQGMLFAFPKSGYQNFWMKDMLISLDMIFIDENWKIVLIEKSVDPLSFPKSYGGKVKSKYVLEINAGEAESFNLEAGDQVIFLNK
jgi:uncharacterized membrane protein (UPF0127 family)